ncbi:hypothetical protein ACT4S2_17695 [Kocuria turfanensis]|uniref:hypothetical protein n=1 Tax=Kocuria turfanensis TaxID=388357 RepID=UPI00403568B5
MDGPTGKYLLKKIQEEKTLRATRKVLKRQSSNVIYGTLLKDLSAGRPDTS